MTPENQQPVNQKEQAKEEPKKVTSNMQQRRKAVADVIDANQPKFEEFFGSVIPQGKEQQVAQLKQRFNQAMNLLNDEQANILPKGYVKTARSQFGSSLKSDEVTATGKTNAAIEQYSDDTKFDNFSKQDQELMVKSYDKVLERQKTDLTHFYESNAQLIKEAYDIEEKDAENFRQKFRSTVGAHFNEQKNQVKIDAVKKSVQEYYDEEKKTYKKDLEETRKRQIVLEQREWMNQLKGESKKMTMTSDGEYEPELSKVGAYKVSGVPLKESYANGKFYVEATFSRTHSSLGKWLTAGMVGFWGGGASLQSKADQKLALEAMVKAQFAKVQAGHKLKSIIIEGGEEWQKAYVEMIAKKIDPTIQVLETESLERGTSTHPISYSKRTLDDLANQEKIHQEGVEAQKQKLEQTLPNLEPPSVEVKPQ